MPNPENIVGKGFEKHPDRINKKGRPVSIKNQLQKILLKDGELPIPLTALVRTTETHYIFKIPTQEAMALKLVNMAMAKGANGFNALKLMLETFDGKAKQSIENIEPPKPISGITFDE
jgi:hypothetical protein